MTHGSEVNAESAEGQGSLVALACMSLLVGAASGLLGAIFRLTLEQADRVRGSVLTWAHGKESTGLLFIIS